MEVVRHAHLYGCQHKFTEMFRRVAHDRPGFVILGDDNDYHTRYSPYILIQSDVNSLRRGKPDPNERAMIENAAGMVVTSPAHLGYLAKRYTLPPTELVRLRPLACDLDIYPLQKRPKTVVYAGGLGGGYRDLRKPFAEIMRSGYELHIYAPYTASQRVRRVYERLGCVWHSAVPEGEPLYTELSQYTIGFHGYPIEASQRYVSTVLPNKCWEYLAAGIPTLGINAHLGGHVYNGRWGLTSDRYEDIPDLLADLERMQVSESDRQREVIDHDLPAFERLAQCL